MNAAIKSMRTVVAVEKRQVHINSKDHALDILAAYGTNDFADFCSGQGATPSEAYAIVYAAACRVAAAMAPLAQPVLADLGVAQFPDAPAEPTRVRSDGGCTRVRDLPTPHLVNIVKKYDQTRISQNAGIFKAIRAELKKRQAEAA